MTNWYDTLAVFDLETTGVDVETSRIVSAHVGVLDARGEVLEARSWLADPGIPIPEQASAVHGITTEIAQRDGRPAAEVIVEIVAALENVAARGLPLVVFNAPYDLTLLDRETQRHDVPPLAPLARVVDPLVIDKGVDRYRPGKRTLEAAAAHYGVALSAAHDAAADAIAAGHVAQALAKKFAAELPGTIEELHAQQVTWCRDQAASFEEFLQRKNGPGSTVNGEWPLRARPAL